ncbi:hypothetical protein C8R42DRAFT_150375 [Lentinula raphanica]|nr:hypothetical protein C8R42DRAFT_150375 [Lentinula raphanica]
MMSFVRRSSKAQTKPKPGPTSHQLPPSLGSELLMMQFMGGGSIERNAKRIMEQQARDIAPASRAHRDPHHHHHHGLDRHNHGQRRRKSAPATQPRLPLGEAYRDERGNLWWDEHEAGEFRDLLTPTQQEQSQGWVTYDPFDGSSHHSTTFSVSGAIPHTHVGAPYPSPTASYHSYANPEVSPYNSAVPPHRRAGSSSRLASGFEDSFNPTVVPLGHAPTPPRGNPVMKEKKGMSLRKRARALFGGH